MNKILFYLMTVCVAACLLACVLLQVFLCEFVKTVGYESKKEECSLKLLHNNLIGNNCYAGLYF